MMHRCLNHRRPPRAAFTLVELVASLGAATALMAGISSTLFIALRASNPANTPAGGMLQSLACMSDMAAELQFAQAVTESTSQAVTAVIPDRSDADAIAETVRYAWSGVAGAPLTRSYNGATAVNVIESVQSVTFEYFPAAVAPEYVTVRIQPSTTTRSVVETSITLLNL
jgi:hypothetical protein